MRLMHIAGALCVTPRCRCGAAEGCLFPELLSDADGKPGVPFRTCDLKPYPVTAEGTTPLAPSVARTPDMAAWTSGTGSCPGLALSSTGCLPAVPSAASVCSALALSAVALLSAHLRSDRGMGEHRSLGPLACS